MSREIVIQKQVLYAFAAALLAAILSSYLVFANEPKSIAGRDNPVPSSSNAVQTNDNGNAQQSGGGQMQEISIRAEDTGYYDKSEITVKKGVPVRLSFSADPGAGCGRYMAIDEFGVKLISNNGETQTAEFTPERAGTYYYHCGMWMFKGKLVVV